MAAEQGSELMEWGWHISRMHACFHLRSCPPCAMHKVRKDHTEPVQIMQVRTASVLLCITRAACTQGASGLCLLCAWSATHAGLACAHSWQTRATRGCHWCPRAAAMKYRTWRAGASVITVDTGSIVGSYVTRRSVVRGQCCTSVMLVHLPTIETSGNR